MELNYLETISKNYITNFAKKRKVTFEDFPSLLYINKLLCGCNKKYNHIIIDEA